MNLKDYKNKLLKAAKDGTGSPGKTQCLRHLNSEKLSIKQAIIAHCYVCTGYYADGKKDCFLKECTLYPWMPYGEAWRTREKRPMSEKRRLVLADMLKNLRKNKTSNCCRITHLESGAVGKSEEGRSQQHNKQLAFKKMNQTSTFQLWLKIKSFEAAHNEEKLEYIIEKQMNDKNLTVEYKVDGKWKGG